MRALLRLLGLIVLAGAFAAAAIDASHSYASGHVELLPLGEVVAHAWPDAIPHLRGALQPRLPALWDPVAVAMLKVPGSALLALIGLLLLAAGRPPPPLIGHSRR